MPNELMVCLLILAAYLSGAVPFGYLVSRALGTDIRAVGSGNIGATNVGREHGLKWGLLVFLLDVVKGFTPTLLARVLTTNGKATVTLAVAFVGLAAIIGHNWPVFLKFKGGKGIAASCGVFLAIFPYGLLAALTVWGVMLAVTRYMSLASMVAALALLAAALFLPERFRDDSLCLKILAGLGALMGILRHRGNIVRLLNGAEPKLGAKKAV